MLKTRFNEIFKTKCPIVQAGMGPYNTENLCIAASKSGALGLISTVGMGSFKMPGLGEFRYSAIFGKGEPSDLLTTSINNVVKALKDYPDAKFGVNIPVSEEFIPTAAELIRTVIKIKKENKETAQKLVAIFTSAGDPLPWSVDPQNKKNEFSIPIKKEIPNIVWVHVVPSVRAAKRCEKAGVDVIVASGRDGGAHCSWRDTTSMVLIPEVINNLKKPIIAAGGFADGKTLAAALALGAIGVQIGTRFIATDESDFEQSWKEILVNSTEEDSMIARGFFGPMRFIRNTRALELVDATIRGASDLYRGIPCDSTEEILNLEFGGIDDFLTGSIDIDKTPVLGGAAAGRIHKILPVKDLIENIMTEAENIIKNMSKFLT